MAGIGKNHSQIVDVVRQQTAAAFQQINGEKEGPAGNEGADVVWHYLAKEP